MSCFEDKVYPFTTEEISGYFKYLNLKDKSVLTVGSSGDQAFNAIYYGARKVTLFDINPNTEKFVREKRDVILHSSFNDFYDKVLTTKIPIREDELFSKKSLSRMNPYMQDEDSFQSLKEKLGLVEIKFIRGDIFSSKAVLHNQKFDQIIFSNILQYLPYFAEKHGYLGRENEFLRKNFLEWISLLNENGNLQLLYYYCFSLHLGNLSKFCKALEDYFLSLYVFDENYDKSDAVVVYVKK